MHRISAAQQQWLAESILTFRFYKSPSLMCMGFFFESKFANLGTKLLNLKIEH